MFMLLAFLFTGRWHCTHKWEVISNFNIISINGKGTISRETGRNTVPHGQGFVKRCTKCCTHEVERIYS